MYNRTILDMLLSEFGLEKCIQFSEMEARLNQIRAMEKQELNEYEHEQMWWEEAHDKLLNMKNDSTRLQESL
jgi:hypothetical protein